MGVVNRLYGVTPFGQYLRLDTANYPTNPHNYDPMARQWSDPTRYYALPLQENLGSLIETYRTGRYVWVYQDISSLTAQLPSNAVYYPPPAYLQPISTVYANIAASTPLGGKS